VSIDLPTGILVPKHLRDTLSITELCELYGISRKTGYKWIDRYLRQGPAAFEERSRRPRGSPNATFGGDRRRDPRGDRDGIWNVNFGPWRLGGPSERHMRIEDEYGKLYRRHV